MRITVFTSNLRRHASLIEALSTIADNVFAIQEVTTLFPGSVEDFYKKSPIMQEYFQRVTDAEERIFSTPSVLPRNVRSFPIRMGDLNRIPPEWLKECLQSDLYVVFGASFIKAPLIDLLLERNAINIHIGVSPFYRGSSCNFWAMHDNKSEYVGATIHRLARGLDSGPILFHAFPVYNGESPFEFTMKAVKSAHQALIPRIVDGSILTMKPHVQNKSFELRYSRRDEFTDNIAAEFLKRETNAADVTRQLSRRILSDFIEPVLVP